MKVRFIGSRDNPLLKTMRLVSSQSRKAPADLVIAEGIRTVAEAAKSGCSIDSVLFEAGFGGSDREKAVLETCIRRGVPLFQADGTAIRSVSDVVTPQGIVALVRLPVRTLSALAPRADALILVASGIQDPGNLGTLIRTAAAAGATLVCTTPGTVSARNPKTIRSSAGAVFHLTVVEGVTPSDFLNYCGKTSVHAYRTSAKEGIPYFQASFRSSCAILLGNEGSGIQDAAWTSLPPLRIPMTSGIESLNVAAAGAILLFEAHRQREEGFRSSER